jgi:hypothetical protein
MIAIDQHLEPKMIRAAFTMFFVVASASAAHANLPQVPPMASQLQSSSNSALLDTKLVHGDRQVTRGHADLITRYKNALSINALA